VLWCLVFGVVHVFWALGGDAGLASSAGSRLAAERPAMFVAFGLWGVAGVLACGALLAGYASWFARKLPALRVLKVLALVVGFGLVARGLLVEVALAVNLGGVRQGVGPLETRWSLALWNPWFMIGGWCFLALALALRCRLTPDASLNGT
jgi:hypothetical protein